MSKYVSIDANGKAISFYDEASSGPRNLVKAGIVTPNPASKIPQTAIEISDAVYAQWMKNPNGLVMVNGVLKPAPVAVVNLESIKANKVQQITGQTDLAARKLAAGYSQAEVMTFAQQFAEATAHAANPAAQTPLLSALAAARGTTVAALAPKVLEKGAAYQKGLAEAIAAQRARTATVAAATTVAAVTSA